MRNTKTDLIIETDIEERMKEKSASYEDIELIKVHIDSEKSKKYRQKEGLYFTIYADYLNQTNLSDRVIDALMDVFKKCIQYFHLKKSDLKKVLIIGLGNREIKSDSLGPLVTDSILVNNHINGKKSHRVVAFVPGVMGKTGIETFMLVQSVAESFSPDLIIAIDSLFSKSLLRINKTIQISTVGVKPGSGMGNHLQEISKDTLNIPVISIGIPTVVDFYSLAFEFMRESDKNTSQEWLDLLKKDEYNMIVSSKDIQDEIEIMSYLLSEAINQFFLLE